MDEYVQNEINKKGGKEGMKLNDVKEILDKMNRRRNAGQF
jgi:hypothetical protein